MVVRRKSFDYKTLQLEEIKELQKEIRYLSSLSDGDQYKKPANRRIAKLKIEIKERKATLEEKLAISQNEPIFLHDDSKETWLYQNATYSVSKGYAANEAKLLILEFVDKERQKFERLIKKFSETDSGELEYKRISIPESIRVAVWRRDQGKCAKCGSRENLEYDHIVPVSRGGSNTERNIELLCQNCNRSKGNRIEYT